MKFCVFGLYFLIGRFFSSFRTSFFTLCSLLLLPALVLFCLPETGKAACKPDTSSKSYGKTIVPLLNLRSTPEISNNLLQRLPKGQEFISLGQIKNGWIHIIETAACQKGWVAKHFVKLHTKKPQKKRTTPVSPVFLTSSSRESMKFPRKPAPKKVPERKKKPKVELIKIPVSNCMKKLKKKAVGYGRVKPLSLNIVSEQDFKSKVAGNFSQGELLTILKTDIAWFYVVEEKTCSYGWIPRRQITRISIEHPLNAGRMTVEPEPLTPCLIKLKRENPIGFGTTRQAALLYLKRRIPKKKDIVGSLKKGQPLSLMKLENNWLEVVEETSCISGWLPYGLVTDITFLRP